MDSIEERKSPPGVRSIAVLLSPGELTDKITILEIKVERISDPVKLCHIRAELETLQAASRGAIEPTEELRALTAELRSVNEQLWNVEDELRLCERREDFGPVFVELARAIYRHNDHRAALKRRINDLLGSELVEEKEYAAYETGGLRSAPK
jgi:hypothetical protein